jgi:hypothetical protein
MYVLHLLDSILDLAFSHRSNGTHTESWMSRSDMQGTANLILGAEVEKQTHIRKRLGKMQAHQILINLFPS